MNTQDKVQAAVERIAKIQRLDLLTDKDYGNVGTWRFQLRGSFVDLVTVRFDFQTGYARFRMAAPPEQEEDIYCELGGDRLDYFLTSLRTLVNEVRPRLGDDE